MNRYENTRSSKIMRRVLSKYAGHGVNLPDLARVINGSYTNLWFYIEGKRKWNLESWLDTLAAIGALQVKENKIILDLNLTEVEKKQLKGIRRRWAKVSEEIEDEA